MPCRITNEAQKVPFLGDLGEGNPNFMTKNKPWDIEGKLSLAHT